MKRVSIVVPVFNSEQFLNICINSILNQTYKNIEIVLVDNGSSDKSLDICYEYEKKYKNIYVYYYIEEKGPGAARNYGIKKSNGEIIGFCDSDDYMQHDMIQTMMEHIEEGCDYVITDMYAERIQSKLGLPWKDGTVFNGYEILKNCVPMYIGNCSDNDKMIPVWGSVVRCLFLKSIITNHNIWFPTNLRFAEDLIFTLQYLKYATSVHIIDKVLYHYRYNTSSLMNSYASYQKNMWNSRKRLIDYITEILISMNIYVDTSKRLNCTVRSYIIDCVGNASKQTNFMYCYKEVKDIINSKYATQAFNEFDAKSLKKRILYYMVKHKMSFSLVLYYRIRRKG